MKLKITLTFGLVLLFVAIISGLYLGLTADLSFKDPEVDLNSITASGRFGVLSAHVNILNSLVFGPSADPDYMKLYGQEATAIYYVDLNEAEVSEGFNTKTGEKIVFVKLLDPSVELYVDETRTENIAEFSVNANWTGNAEEGYRAYFKQSEAGYTQMLDSLQESDGLMLEAKDCAIQRVTELLDGLSMGDVEFEVFFSSSEQKRR